MALVLLAALLLDEPLVYARAFDSTTLDPAEVEYGEDAKVTENLYEGLFSFREGSTEIEERLAVSWSVEEDGKRWTFRLRGGVKFHDGTDFDADAVVCTFERLLAKDQNRPYAEVFAIIEKVEARDGAASFRLKRPYSALPKLLALPGAAIVSPTAVRKHGKQFSGHPCGTGPYRFSEWRNGERLVVERFDGYWGPKPPIRRVVFVPMSEEAAIERIKNGEVHVWDYVSPFAARRLEKMGVRLERQSSLNVCYLGFNLKRFPYSDRNFRAAVALALNRKEIRDVAYYGEAEIARNLVPPASWRDSESIPEYESDLEKAREFLSRVKLPSDFAAEIWHMSLPRPYMPEPDLLVSLIQSQLEKIGLKVRTRKFERAAWAQQLRKQEHPMFVMGWMADYADPDNFYGALLTGGAKNELNYSYWENRAFDELLVRTEGEPDRKKRHALFVQAFGIYREEMPTLPLVHATSIVACSRKIRYEVHPMQVRLANIRFENP